MNRIRAGFIAQGSSYHEWCRQKGVLPSSARQAVLGAWDGKKGREMRAQIIEAAKLGALR